MRNEAGRYVLSIILVVLVSVAYTLSQVDTEDVLAKGSQAGIQLDNKINDPENDDKAENKDKNDSEETLTAEVSAEAGHTEKVKAYSAESSRVRTFRATAYCLKGKTALGQRVRRGLIAADPRVLPLGTSVEIIGTRYAGTYLVSDTGTKVKGSKIDIWVPSCREAMRWGHRTIKLRVVKKKGRK